MFPALFHTIVGKGFNKFAKFQDQVFSLSRSVQLGHQFSMAKPLHAVN